MRAQLAAFGVSFLVLFGVACLDFSGAPCKVSESCPANQICVAGACCVTGSCPGGGSSTGGGGTARTGGGSGTGGGVSGTGGGVSGTGGGAPGSAKECEPCKAAGDCATGLSCGKRACDGATACYSTNGSCGAIAGVSCPKVLNFRACTASTDCGPQSACMFGRCLQQCAKSTDCSIPSADVKTFIDSACVTYQGDSRCYPSCTKATDLVCGPFGSYCEQFASKTYGYCELGCGGCASDADCAADHQCKRRLCDALPGCYPSDGGTCSSISLNNCPTAWNFASCTTKSDCGTVSDCLTVGTITRCFALCKVDTDCINVTSGAASYPTACRTGLTGGASACVPTCSAAQPCPTGTTCVAAGDGRSYCQ